MGSTRKFGKWGWVALALSAVLAGSILAGCGMFTRQQLTGNMGTVSPLDDTIADGDGVVPVSHTNLDFGTVTQGSSVSKDVLVAIKRQGGVNSGYVFANGATVTITVQNINYNGDPWFTVPTNVGTITLPEDWVTNGDMSDPVTSTVTLITTTPGNYTGHIVYAATGPNAKDGNSIKRTEQLNVFATIVRAGATTYSISGAKWDDKDGDSTWDAGEPGLGGWKITLYSWNGTGYVKVKDTYTDNTGAYTFSGLEPGKYKVEEEPKDGWVQTFPGDPGYHEVTIADQDIDDLNFGNVRVYSISGAKWYDRNRGGTWDNGEPGIKGWKIFLYAEDGTTLLDSTVTGPDGGYKFTGLKPGTYVVKEGPVSGTWIQTYPTNPNHHTVTIVDEDITQVNFGNVCEVTATGGYTLGFWSNTNGQKSLTNGWTTYLSGYNLVDKNGNAFDPPNYSAFKTWLLRADSVNMSYMLSVQLAATLLNIRYKGANYDELGIVVDGTWTSIAGVITAANSFLGSYPNTRDGHPQRARAEFYKNVFDGLNNNRLKLIPYNPCPLPVWL